MNATNNFNKTALNQVNVVSNAQQLCQFLERCSGRGTDSRHMFDGKLAGGGVMSLLDLQ